MILCNSGISGQCLGDNEMLCAMEPSLWLEKVPSSVELEQRVSA